jgi:hypothetical protein
MEEHDLRIRNLEVVTSRDQTPPPHRGEPCGALGQGDNHPASHPSKGKGRLALLWGIGGSVLSAVGLVALTIFQLYNDSLNELRRDLKHFNEASADLVKKESLDRFRGKVAECSQRVHATAAARAQVERDLLASEGQRKALESELQRLRERLAAVEGRQAATPVVIPPPHPEPARDGNADRAPAVTAAGFLFQHMAGTGR